MNYYPIILGALYLAPGPQKLDLRCFSHALAKLTHDGMVKPTGDLYEITDVGVTRCENDRDFSRFFDVC